MHSASSTLTYASFVDPPLSRLWLALTPAFCAFRVSGSVSLPGEQQPAVITGLLGLFEHSLPLSRLHSIPRSLSYDI
jgi:hypothetical protein